MPIAKRHTSYLSVLLLSGLGFVSTAHAAFVEVADYSNDFPTPLPGNQPVVSEGWSYSWNSLGAIGNAANYQPLVWAEWSYQVDSDTALGDRVDTDGSPGSDPQTYPDGVIANDTTYIYLSEDGVHPGVGTAQQGAGGVDRYAIAGFTLGKSAETTITGNVTSPDGNSQGTDVRIYVDDVLIASGDGKPTYNFNLNLGILSAGQTVYVAVGPAGSHSYDGSSLDFSISQAPEPASLGLACAWLALLAARRRRSI